MTSKRHRFEDQLRHSGGPRRSGTRSSDKLGREPERAWGRPFTRDEGEVRRRYRPRVQQRPFSQPPCPSAERVSFGGVRADVAWLRWLGS